MWTLMQHNRRWWQSRKKRKDQKKKCKRGPSLQLCRRQMGREITCWGGDGGEKLKVLCGSLNPSLSKHLHHTVLEFCSEFGLHAQQREMRQIKKISQRKSRFPLQPDSRAALRNTGTWSELGFLWRLQSEEIRDLHVSHLLPLHTLTAAHLQASSPLPR